MVWIDNSRIIATYAVVFIHVSAIVLLHADVGMESWWFANIYNSIVRWCVPVFVMISGALLLDPIKNEKISEFYKKRISRILLPLFFWSIFFLFWNFLKGSLKGDDPNVMVLIKTLLSGQPHYHMWFLYMLLNLYLFTPFFRKIVSHSTKKELVFLIVITFIFAAINYIYETVCLIKSTLFINWFLMYIPFFFLGHIVCQDNGRHSKLLLWATFLFSVVFTSIGCYFELIQIDIKTGQYFYGGLSVSVIPMSISLIYLLKTWAKPIINETFTKRASLLSLGIYLIHPVILEILNFKGYGGIRLHPFMFTPVIASIVFAIALTAAWTISHVPYLRRTI